MLRQWVRSELLRAAPYAVLLAVALGSVVVLGVNLSNATPSESRPFGWPGTSPLWNGVATVRSDLVLATTLPALLWGVAFLGERDARAQRLGRVARGLALHLPLLALAVLLATTVGALAASKVHERAFWAFFSAHLLLALSFFSLALLAGALARRWALPLAGLVWVAFHASYENWVRFAAFRDAGYHALTNGQFPAWFYVAQALSPLSAYRGVLILWEKGFMNYEESYTLGKATLPAWVNPSVFMTLGLALWVALPLALAALAWWWRGREVATPTSRAETA